MTILLDPVVRLKLISDEMIAVCRAVWNAYQADGMIPVMTGAADENYRPGGAHVAGRGWDFRVRGLAHPDVVAAEIRTQLESSPGHYTVLYGDAQHLDHIHVHVAPLEL